jgi:uncharacterized protein
MSQTDVINITKKYLNNLSRMGIPIYKAYLYGSYARNEATEESDIDVLIISDDYNSFDLKKKSLAWAATDGIDLRIEPYTIGTNRLLSDDSFILNQALKEGIEITI